MSGDEKLFFAPFLSLDDVQSRWPNGKLRNDCIESFRMDITGHFGCIVSPRFNLVEQQPFGCGYASTANVGFIIKRVAELFDLFEDDTRDFYKAITRCPLRIYSWGHAGDSVMETICIGHFMKDRFIYGYDLMLTGLPIEIASKQRSGV